MKNKRNKIQLKRQQGQHHHHQHQQHHQQLKKVYEKQKKQQQIHKQNSVHQQHQQQQFLRRRVEHNNRKSQQKNTTLSIAAVNYQQRQDQQLKGLAKRKRKQQPYQRLRQPPSPPATATSLRSSPEETETDIPNNSQTANGRQHFKPHSRQQHSTTLAWLCRLMLLTLLCDMPTWTKADWLMDCGDCHCKWNSGKKTADCKNLTLSSVPENLSNEVQVLDLSLNRIVYLEENAFLTADLTNLHKLYIRNSTLQHIDPRTFTQLEILIELDLSNNLLRVLQANVFARLVKVRAIVLNGNILESLGDGIFQNLKYLHKIELKDNRLLKMGTQVFVNLPLLSQIYLNNNRFGFLRKESFESVKRLTALSLDGNPWNCTCELQIFRDFVLRRNLYTPPTACYYPSQLRGMLWIEDQPEAFACKPRIIFPAKGASITTSKENVTLVCRVHASANTHIAWDYNKQIYRSSGQQQQQTPQQTRIHIQIIQDEQSKEKEFGRNVFISRLTILGAEKSDEGTYTCLAENAGGKDAVQMSLLVEKSNSRDMLLQGNLAAVISLMALGLLSVSVFLALVTCCIYKRFITSAAAHQHRHHHLDLSGNDPLTTHGTVVANHGTTTMAGNTDVMLGVVNGLDGSDMKYSKKHHQQSAINGGTSLIKDKYTELLKHNGGNVVGGTLGVGGGGVGVVGIGDDMGTGNSPLMEGKANCDVQLGQLEKKYYEQKNDDMLTIKYPHGRVLAEVNVAMTATTGHTLARSNDGLLNNAGVVGDFQPDLLPAYASNKINTTQQQQQQDFLYSPVITPGSTNSANTKTITSAEEQQRSQQHHQLAAGNTSTLPANSANMTTSRSKYNNCAQDYLQTKFGSLSRKQNRSQEKLSTGSSSLNLTRSSPINEILNSVAATRPQSKSLFMPQRTVCSATTTATPTDTTGSYEYRQPPPPPYNATHRTTGNLLPTRRTSFNHHDNIEDNNRNSNTKDQGYRESSMALYETARQTIVTASPSMSFPTTITGFNTNTATISPRRQLL